MSPRTKILATFWAGLALTVLPSLYSVALRHRIEAANRSVTLAAEFEVVENLAAAQGIPVDKAVDRLKARGLTALALSEETLGQLVTEGRLTLGTTSTALDASEGGVAAVQSLSVTVHDLVQLSRIVRGIQIRFGDQAGSLAPRGRMIMLPHYSPLLVRATPVGLNPYHADVAKRAGLPVIARCANPPGISARAVGETLAWAKEYGATTFLPMGDQVLGRRNATDATVEAIRKLGLNYATPEFAKIGGDSTIVQSAPDHVVRLHSAQVAELDKMSVPFIVERYAKAARERNMRILLVRPSSYGGVLPLNDFGELIGAIGDQVRKEGGEIGPARPFQDAGVPRPVSPVIAFGVALAGWASFALAVAEPRARLAAAAFLGLAAAASMTGLGLSVAALLAAMVFPLAGFVLLLSWRPKSPAAGFAFATAVSLIGGLAVAGMLNRLPYTVGASEFQGVKVAVFLPIALVGLLALAQLADWRSHLKSPITWGTAVLGLVVAGALAFMVARTGNDSGVGASGLELKLRNLLDAVLYVRPRTKEFLIGHPMLVIGLGLLARYGRTRGPWAAWTALALMIGAMGQTSVVNTLCHLHIPVALSLARILIGAVLGCIIGAVAWALIEPRLPKPQGDPVVAD